MFREIRDYCIDNVFHFSYQNEKLNVVNYLEVLVLEEARISLRCDLGLMIIKGENLSIQKLLDQEILISGKIKSIELGG